MSDRARGGMFRAALSHRDYRFLLSRLAVSETGNWLYAAASIIYILDATGSTAWIGVAAVVRLLPYILFGPIGGAIADRFDRRKVMIVSDLARAALMGVLTVVAMSDSTTAVVTAIAIAFVNNSFSAPYYPAVTAITPSVVTEDDLAAANALSGTIDNFALAFGPALSAVLLLLGRPPVAFAANGLTFLLSAFLVTRISVRGKVGEVEVEADPALTHGRRRGVRSGRRTRRCCSSGLSIAFGFTFGQEIVLFGPITEDFLGMSLDATGLLFAAPGIGGILATAAAGKLAVTQPHGGHPRGLGADRRHPAHGALGRARARRRLPAAHDRGRRGDHRRRRHHHDAATGRARGAHRQRLRHPRRRDGRGHRARVARRADHDRPVRSRRRDGPRGRRAARAHGRDACRWLGASTPAPRPARPSSHRGSPCSNASASSRQPPPHSSRRWRPPAPRNGADRGR